MNIEEINEKIEYVNIKLKGNSIKRYSVYLIPAIALLIIIAGFFAGSFSKPAGPSGFVVIDLVNNTRTDIIPGNEPFFFCKENETKGVLLLHGFTASPWEVKLLGDYLIERNISVYAPLIAGHGTSPEELRKTRWEDWYESVNDSYTELIDIVDCVYVAGVSTGGSLELMLAEEHELCGVISIGAPVFLKDWKSKLAWIFKYFIPYTRKPVHEDKRPYYYERRPTASVAELVEMIEVMKEKLPEVSEPILIIQSLEDMTVKPESGKYIVDNVASENKTLVLFEKGNHVLVRGNQQEQVFDLVYEFIS